MPATADAATKGERTRHALLDAAVRRFAVDGYRGTSVSEVAREVGLTPAAVYAYFPNKEALFRAAVDADSAAFITHALGRVFTGDFDRDWHGLMGLLLEALATYPLARRVLGGLEPEFTQRLLDIPALQDLRRDLEALLAGQQRSGELRPDVDPHLLAIGIETIFLSQLIAIQQTGLPVDSERTDGVAAVLEAALSAPAPPVKRARRPSR